MLYFFGIAPVSLAAAMAMTMVVYKISSQATHNTGKTGRTDHAALKH